MRSSWPPAPARARCRTSLIHHGPIDTLRQERRANGLEYEVDGVGERQPGAVPAAEVAPGEEQRNRLHSRIHDERSAVATIAEPGRAGTFDFNLTVEPQVAQVVVHDDVVEVEGRDAAACRAGRPADLVDEVALVDERRTQTPKAAVASVHEAAKSTGVMRHVVVDAREGSVDPVRPATAERRPPEEPRDGFRRCPTAIERRTLQDRVAARSHILVRKDVIVR